MRVKVQVRIGIVEQGLVDLSIGSTLDADTAVLTYIPTYLLPTY